MEENRDVAINMERVNKVFKIRDRPTSTIRDGLTGLFNLNPYHIIHALKDINLKIYRGEFFGIIGRNGSGKSTLLNVMTGAYPPDKGGISAINGKFIRLSLGMGFNPELSARQNIYTNASILGLTFKEIGASFDKIMDFSELHEFVDTKVKYFSKGMKSRLAFAIAIHAKADILLMDEFFGGVGDSEFNQKCKQVFQRTFIDGRTIVHVSHKMNIMKKYCSRVLWLANGEVMALGKPEEVIKAYKASRPQKEVVPDS